MRAAAIFVCASLALGGCSWLFMESPRSDYEPQAHGSPHCTGAYGWPVWDTTLATLHMLSGLAALTAEGVVGDEDDGEAAVSATLSFGVGTVHAISAYSGYTNVSDCKAAREHYYDDREEFAPGVGLPGEATPDHGEDPDRPGGSARGDASSTEPALDRPEMRGE